ncbi:MAG: hypothetical protein A2W61_01730 [Deltaproteobacteria bacterium RIFCSPLOWO2_01_44_7]|nr:MAG: hypothetical protein A2712_10825 [Deltaproteobacteria bacterium RIFCSPHIGHO2_01_FULL_43_49]OGQ16547.1 MAG: hypothetical protein A3D22_06525 [Deltaproteobacteria bacterium RIFCSPHIGHO2_02_FULL_44_53]OGQ28364.1 MAG: hypothetical protein A3D98_06230 [Deltaproteobacteria bacterium RIFCSPHIGHO2_12_FULL_44_21]OGQ32435.1 MAG: hypothetical protein A2979_10790 [Deltaproteobacteria bacterium RIFCSPLOWO2_01_FULL_45_74]OGQ41560.1 MAG: hypothetical protein A3I70_05135 [Deltaproteobacteria bacterium 
MVTIRKTSNVLPFGKISSSKSVSSTSESSSAVSPFAAKPVDALKAITQRKSRLSEEQKLAILQRALSPFSNEARGHLPTDVSQMEEEVRKRMMKEGFSETVANEAGEETVDVLLEHRRVVRKSHSSKA